ncbi:MAG: HD domain-containing protein, partial [Lachnospiraceae bacterium]|nr:HD domain-containing protein [Lachnospiraceae bacterium]
YVMQFCKKNVPKLLVALMIVFHTVVLFLVFASKYFPYYYSRIDFVDEGLFTHLHLDKGPMYYAFLASTIIYVTIIMYNLLKTYRVTVLNDERRQIKFLISAVMVCFGSMVIYFTGITGGYDTTVAGYFIAAVMLMFSLFRYRIFDALTQAKEYVVDNLDSGVLVLDINDELLYHNAVAQKIYPGLASDEYEHDIDSIKQHYIDDDYIYSNDRVYHVTREDIDNNDEKHGQLYVLTDVTESYNYTERLKHDVEEKTEEIRQIQYAVIASFANMVEARDGATGLHIRNTSLYVDIVARALQTKEAYRDFLSDKYVQTMIEAAPLHDIGKIAISDTILCKPGKLTDEEFNIMKTHSAIGAEMIDEVLAGVGKNEYLSMAKDMAHYHHERWDGTGYPNGLKGEEIPVCARVMAIADVYDALRSKRSYKDGFSKEKSLNIIKESAGTHFDPKIVEVFVEQIEEIEKVQP